MSLYRFHMCRINSWFMTSTILLGITLVSCNKLIDVGPPSNTINKENVYSTDLTAINVVNGIYAGMSSLNLGTMNSLNSFMPVYAGLSADELKPFSGANTTYMAYYQNSLTNMTYTPWESIYSSIFTTNVVLEGLTGSATLTPGVKDELMGEARFLRAFHYYYLVNLYGDVPLVLSSNYRDNSLLGRADKGKVLEQVLADLRYADSLLSDTYRTPDLSSVTEERTVPTKWAAELLLARTSLQLKKYPEAEQYASSIIGQSQLFALDSLGGVFLKGSHEPIWQLQPVNQGWNTEDARFFMLPSSGPGENWPVYLTDLLINAFENGDKRKEKWINSVSAAGQTYYYPYKYKNATLDAAVTEYAVVLRLGEVYLVRAEARAQEGKLADAVDDLNMIRSRAGLANYSGPLDKAALLDAISHERQVELFTEWGHRWLDLKRMEKIDVVMNVAAPMKGGSWKSFKQLYPLSFSEIQHAPNLVQTPGY